MSPFKPDALQLYIQRNGPPALPEPPRRGAPIDITISDTLARYWILDEPAGLTGAAELDLYAADRFSLIFGDDPAHWVIRVDPAPASRYRLACALPGLYAIDLPGFAKDRGWLPRLVQTRFIREFNRNCARLGRHAVFCVASRECTSLGLIMDGQWRSIRVHPPLDRSTASFSTLLRRDCRQAGIAFEGVAPVIVGSLREQVE